MLQTFRSPSFYKQLAPTRQDLFKMVFWLGMATAVAWIFSDLFIEKYNSLLLYALVVVIISCTTKGYLCGPITAVLSVLWVNYTFTYPYFALNFSMTGYPFTFATMFLVSMITSTMTVNVRIQAKNAEEQRAKTQALNELSWSLLYAADVVQVRDVATDILQDIYQCSVLYLVGDPQEGKHYYRPHGDAPCPMPLPPAELEAAMRCCRNLCLTGGREENCRGLYLPIAGGNSMQGVIGLFVDNGSLSCVENEAFLNTVAAQVSAVVERHEVLERQNRLMLAAEREQMRSNLLRAVSHDLRTPLTGIMGASSAILENGDALDRATHDKLLSDIQKDSQWLIHMVENLLSVTRISEGQQCARVTKVPEAAEEIIGESISRVRGRNPGASIHVSVPDELLFVPMDGTLIEQVIINLVENALKHSGSSQPVDVSLTQEEGQAVFSVRDRGKGIPAEMQDTLFDGAARDTAAADSSRGMGIGLSICKSIIHAHQGTIEGGNHPEGGAYFRFTLPLEGE